MRYCTWKRILVFGILLAMLVSLCACEQTEGTGLREETGGREQTGGREEMDGGEELHKKQIVYLPETYTECREDISGEWTYQKKYGYDDRGKIVSLIELTTYSDLQKAAKAYEEACNSVVTTTFTYDLYGNLSREQQSTMNTYADGRVLEYTQDCTYTYTYNEYAQVQRCVVVINRSGESTVESDYIFTYDSKGNLVLAQSQLRDAWQYYEYDSKNRLVKETSASKGWDSWSYLQETYVYDSEGRVSVWSIHEAKSKTDVGYEALDTLALGEAFSQDPYTMHYNQQGKLSGYNDEPEKFTYDKNGNLVLKGYTFEKKYRGKTVEVEVKYEQDAHGNVIRYECNYPDQIDKITYISLELNEEDAENAKRLFVSGRHTMLVKNFAAGNESHMYLYPFSLTWFVQNDMVCYYSQLIRNPLA